MTYVPPRSSSHVGLCHCNKPEFVVGIVAKVAVVRVERDWREDTAPPVLQLNESRRSDFWNLRWRFSLVNSDTFSSKCNFIHLRVIFVLIANTSIPSRNFSCTARSLQFSSSNNRSLVDIVVPTAAEAGVSLLVVVSLSISGRCYWQRRGCYYRCCYCYCC